MSTSLRQRMMAGEQCSIGMEGQFAKKAVLQKSPLRDHGPIDLAWVSSCFNDKSGNGD